MTMREIDSSLRNIYVTRHNEYAKLAGLQGQKIPFKHSAWSDKVKAQTVQSDFSKKEDMAALFAMRETMARRGVGFKKT